MASCATRILYASRNYLVRHSRVSGEPRTVVVFDPWSAKPTLEGAFFGEAFFANRGINAIGVKPASNDWYQGRDMPEVAAAIVDATLGTQRIGYGGSMGAYAVINFAEDLALDTVIALGPQFSVDPAKAPFETRWNDEVAKITFRHDKIDRIRPIANGYLLFDPTVSDGEHAKMILRRHSLTPLKLYFSSHHPLTLLAQSQLLKATLLEMIGGHFDRRAFMAALRRERRRSSWCWLHASKALRARGELGKALTAVRMAQQLGARNPAPIEAQLAELLTLTRQSEADRTATTLKT